jgi:hypothetical protein
VTPANPKLLILAAGFLAVTLVFRIVPGYFSTWSTLKADRESLRQELEYYRDLIDDETKLEARAAEIAGIVAGIEDTVFQVPSSLLGSEVQAIIRNIGGRSGVEVREMRVAEVESIEDWLRVSQELSFTIDQRGILPFLNALRAHRPRLYISHFTVTRSRQQFVGSATIQAFSRP